MGVLAMNIEQLIARHSHLLQGRAAPVYKAARATPGIQHTAQQAHALVAFQCLFVQPALHFR